MRFTTLRGAARARRRFVRDFDPSRGYRYTVRRFANGFEVDIHSDRGTFLAIL